MFSPVPPKALVPEMKKSLLVAYAGCGSIPQACEMVGITPQQAYSWRTTDPSFGQSWDLVTRECVVPALEQAAIERAKEKSDLLLMFLLKAYKRELYDDRAALAKEEDDKQSRRISVVFVDAPPLKDVNGVQVLSPAGPNGTDKVS